MTDAPSQPSLQAEGEFGAVDLALKSPDGSSRDPRPAIVFWPEPLIAGPEADRLVAAVAAGFAQAGFIVVLPKSPSLIRVEHEALVLKAAVEAVREHPSVDAERIGLLGYSLGGLLAADRAADCQPLHRVALLAPTALATAAALATTAADARPDDADDPTIAEKDASATPSENGSGGDVRPAEAPIPVDLAARWRTREAQAAVKAMKPVERLEALDCPVLIMHGAADTQAPARIGGRWAWSASQERGTPIESLLIARGDHAFSNADVRGTCLSELLRFFAPMLGPSPAAGAKPKTDSAA